MATTDRRVLGGDGEVVGVAEAADVVADDRAGRARRVEHRRAPRVERDRRRRSARASASIAGTTRSSSSASPTSGPGPGLDAADVEEVGAVARPAPRPAARNASNSHVAAAVVERVGRAVEDAHHQRAARDVDRRHRGAGWDTGRRTRRPTICEHGPGVRFRTPRRTNPVRRPCGSRRSGRSPRTRNRSDSRRRARRTLPPSPASHFVHNPSSVASSPNVKAAVSRRRSSASHTPGFSPSVRPPHVARRSRRRSRGPTTATTRRSRRSRRQYSSRRSLCSSFVARSSQVPPGICSSSRRRRKCAR